jgi:hypothetical protein
MSKALNGVRIALRISARRADQIELFVEQRVYVQASRSFYVVQQCYLNVARCEPLEEVACVAHVEPDDHLGMLAFRRGDKLSR